MVTNTRVFGLLTQVLLCLALASVQFAWAADPISDPKKLNRYVERLSSLKGIKYVEDARKSSKWESTKSKTHFGFKNRENWFRIKLTPFIDKKNRQLLEFGFIYQDKIEAFFFVNDELVHQAISGDNVPFEKRFVENRKILFQIPESGDQEVYLYFKTFAHGMTQIPLTLWTNKDFERFDANDRVWNGFYSGAIIIMLFYHLFLYSIVRKPDVLAYMVLLTGVLFFRMIEWGYTFQYMWPSGPEFTNRVPIAINCFNMIASFLFCYYFLAVEKYSMFMAKYLKGAAIGAAIATLFCLVGPFPIAVMITILYGTITNVSITVVAINLMFKGVRVARFYFFAIIPVLVAISLMLFSFIGIIDVGTLSRNGGSIGLLMMICLLAIGIGDKIRFEQNEARKEILSLNEGLESKVAERTQDLEHSLSVLKNTQTDLVEAEKMAALTGLVSGVAHEINTPLGVGITAATSLKSESDALHKKVDKDELSRSHLDMFLSRMDEAVGLIENSFTRASQQVKSFKHLTIDLPDSKMHPFHVREHLLGSVEMLRKQLDSHHHEVEVDCAESLVVSSYASLVTQVLVNLMSNSIQHAYSPGQRGHLHIHAHTVGNHLILDYKDDGKGLTDEELRSLFDPFYTSKRGSGHVGLGTTVTYNIVTHGLKGTIRPASKPGEGLSYHIRIPVEAVKS